MKNSIYFLNGQNKEINTFYLDKEYRDDIMVEINGLYYELYFFTPSAIEYEFTNEGFFSLPGMVILSDVSTDRIIDSIRSLYGLGYFDWLRGHNNLSQEKRFLHNWYSNDISIYEASKIIRVEFE